MPDGFHQAHTGARANPTLTGVKEIDQESDAHQLQAENDRHPVQREKQDQVGATGYIGNIASPASGEVSRCRGLIQFVQGKRSPASPAAMPVSTKIPAPMPIMVASKRPRLRANVTSVSGEMSSGDDAML